MSVSPRWLPLALILSSACGDTALFVNRETTDSWQQAPTDEVDILWVIDNSNSMKLEQDLLAAGFDSFVSSLEETNTNFHLGVITTDFDYDDPNRGVLVGEPIYLDNDDDYQLEFAGDPNAEPPIDGRALVGLNGSGKEKGLEAAAYALSPQMTTTLNAGFLRSDANLLVVFVSDEDDCSDDGALGPDADNRECYSRRDDLTPVGELVDAITSVKSTRDRVQLAAIVGPPDAGALCDENTLPGTRYIEAARLTAGLAGSICETDWSGFLSELGLNAAGIFTVFQLSHGAAEGTLVVTVDGQVVPVSETDGYTYDPENFTIEFHGIWIPERGAGVLATYTIQSGT